MNRKVAWSLPVRALNVWPVAAVAPVPQQEILVHSRTHHDYDAVGSRTRQLSWFIYDLQDLGSAAKGDKKLGQVVPHSETDVALPGVGGTLVTGSCFDPDTQLLYLYPQSSKHCIRAYRLKD